MTAASPITSTRTFCADDIPVVEMAGSVSLPGGNGGAGGAFTRMAVVDDGHVKHGHPAEHANLSVDVDAGNHSIS